MCSIRATVVQGVSGNRPPPRIERIAPHDAFPTLTHLSSRLFTGEIIILEEAAVCLKAWTHVHVSGATLDTIVFDSCHLTSIVVS